MSGAAELSSVAYKKGNWLRYILWGLAAACIVLLTVTFVNMMNGEISAAVPTGYRFAVSDNYHEGSNVRTTYYVYEDKVLVESESTTDGTVNRSVMIYDGLSTANLKYNAEEVSEECIAETCQAKPKVLRSVKKLLAGKVGREYIGF